jgi:hypothetical protein
LVAWKIKSINLLLVAIFGKNKSAIKFTDSQFENNEAEFVTIE